MKKVICSPGSYIQGNDELSKLAEYCKEIGVRKSYLIVDKFIYDNYKEKIVSSFEKSKAEYEIAIFGGECSNKEINAHREAIKDREIVIGIGGGKTLDTSKAVAHYEHKPVMIVPTAASTDAPCSRLSVVYKENGEFESYLPLINNPDMVIMDTEIISKAPVRFLVAGIGDALATYYEADACQKGSGITMVGGNATKAAMALGRLCLETLLEQGLKAKIAVENKVCTKAVEDIVETNTYLSGMGFESGGLAAAHAIQNGLTVLEETHKLLHGEKVAFGTLSQLVLENKPIEEIEEIINFCKIMGLPTTFKDLGIDKLDDEQLMKVAEASCAPDDTMGNMYFKVTPLDVLAAMKVASKLSENLN